jgi:preprotein translocase subunit YajC
MELVQLLPLLAIVLLFWVMVVRPASRRQKEMARLQESLQPGQQVMLSAGVFGTIRSLTDERARLEVAPGVEIEVVRGAVSTVVDHASAGGSTDAGSAGPVEEQP